MTATLIVMGLSAVFMLYVHLTRLQRRVHQLEVLVNHGPVAMFWCDRHGKILGANDLLLDAVKTELPRLKGQFWFERLLPDEAALQIRHRFLDAESDTITFSAPLIGIDGSAEKMKWVSRHSETYWIFALEDERRSA